MAHRVLLVDDDPFLLESLSGALSLKLQDMAVDTCESGAEALDRIVVTDYDAVVCDIKMPRMDGLTVMAKALELRPMVPVLLITGHGDRDLSVKALNAGAYAFIQKPIDRDYFMTCLKRAIQMRGQVRGLSRQEEEQTRNLHVRPRKSTKR